MSFSLHTHAPYLVFILLMVIGCYLLLTYHNLVRALVGLYLMQSGVILFFILLAVRSGGTVPIMGDHGEVLEMVNPLPHAMMLTAIVVGLAILGVGLALLYQIQNDSGHLEDDIIDEDDA